MTKEMKPYGPMVLVFDIGAFAEISSDVDALAGIIASAFTADYIRPFSTSAAGAKGMYKQRVRAA